MLNPNLPPLLAALVADVAPGTPIPSTVQRGPCAGCGEPVYLAAVSRRLIDAGKAQATCSRCLKVYATTNPTIALTPVMPPGTAAEQRQWTREENERN